MRTLSLIFAGAYLASAAAIAYDESRDAVVVDPEHHVVVLENEQVRVIEARAGVGATSPMHTHPDYLLVGVSFVRLRLHLPDGEQPEVELKPGQVMWIENAEHGWEVLEGELHAVAIEVKSAQR